MLSVETILIARARARTHTHTHTRTHTHTHTHTHWDLHFFHHNGPSQKRIFDPFILFYFCGGWVEVGRGRRGISLACLTILAPTGHSQKRSSH